jgi:endonuclease G, mitochondrial
MKLRLTSLLLLFALAQGLFGGTSHPSKGSPSKSARFTAQTTSWKALDWDPITWEGFEGRPKIKLKNHQIYLIPRKRYVVEYDTNLLNPLWTAHISTKESAANLEQRPESDPDWARPDKFKPDPFLVTLYTKKGVSYTVHDDLTNSGYQRGHMTPNAEMKGFDQGSQIESFYMSNICPQLGDHNGTIWAALEAYCIEWAKAFGTVYVITGPVFNDPDHPSKKTQVKGKKKAKNQIPVPDQFFKIVIAERNGRTIAVGFLIPHKNGLRKKDLFRYQVPIDDIEEVTRINFMPDMGEPNPLEQGVDSAWKASLN